MFDLLNRLFTLMAPDDGGVLGGGASGSGDGADGSDTGGGGAAGDGGVPGDGGASGDEGASGDGGDGDGDGASGKEGGDEGDGASGDTGDKSGASDGDSGEDGNDGGDGSGDIKPAAWQAQGKGEIKTRKDLAEFETISDLVAAYDVLKEKVSKNPQVPSDAGEYGIDEELGKEFLNLGIDKASAKGLSEFIAKREESAKSELFNLYAGTKKDADLWIRETYGKDHVKAKADMNRALEFAPPETYKLITTTAVGNNTALLSFLQKVGSMFAEDGFPLSEAQGGMVDEETAKLQRLYPSMFGKKH